MTQTQTQKQTRTKILNMSWDKCEIADKRATQLLEEGTVEDERDAVEQALEYWQWFESMYEEFLNDLWEVLKEISPEGYFHVEGRNMGWRQLSGHADIQAGNPHEYIYKTFPNTEWSFEGIYDPDTRCMSYKLWHHDAPTGEYYEVTAGKPDEDN